MPFSRTLILSSLVMLAACNEPPNDPAPPTVLDPAVPAPDIVVADPPVSREALLLAIARAASDHTAGTTDPDNQRDLDNKPFEVALRFGCAGDDTTSRSWSFDEAERILRLRVEPQISLETALLSELGYQDFEAVEGFWIRRPWLLQATCPPAPRSETPAPTQADASEPEPVVEPSPRTPPLLPQIGIAQFFTADDSRSARRNSRAYEATEQLSVDETPSRAGYDLVLSGRLSSLPDGRVIACTGPADRPPSCIVSVKFDHVRLQAADGTAVADWTLN